MVTAARRTHGFIVFHDTIPSLTRVFIGKIETNGVLKNYQCFDLTGKEQVLIRMGFYEKQFFPFLRGLFSNLYLFLTAYHNFKQSIQAIMSKMSSLMLYPTEELSQVDKRALYVLFSN